MFSAKPYGSKADIEKGCTKHPSITDYLPWLDYSDKHQVFLLKDQRSVAVALSIKPVECEVRPLEQMQAIQQAISEALKNAISLEKTDPWIVQRDNQLHGVMEQVYDSVQQGDTSVLIDAHLQALREHLDFFQVLSETEAHLHKMANSAVGHHALAVKIHEQLDAANHAMVHGDYVLPLTMALYIREHNL